MKTYFKIALTLIASLSLFSSCDLIAVKGNGKLQERLVPIANYSNIIIESSNIELLYTANTSPGSLTLETDQNIWDELELKVENETLKIRSKNRNMRLAPSRFVLHTGSEQLKELNAAGSGVLRLDGRIEGKELDVNLAGKITLEADALFVDKVDCNTAGDCTMNLSGTISTMDIKDAGKSYYQAFGLNTDNLDCKTAGSSTIEITVHNEISANMVGHGTIRYKGNPKTIDNHSVGGVSIKPYQE